MFDRWYAEISRENPGILKTRCWRRIGLAGRWASPSICDSCITTTLPSDAALLGVTG
jgi:hypothetical protein